jgi:hypothetical protein
MLRRLYPCVIRKRISNHPPAKYFDPKGRKKYHPDTRLELGMLRRLYPCVIRKGPTIHQQEYFDPKGEKYQPAGRLTDSTGDAAVPYPLAKPKLVD